MKIGILCLFVVTFLIGCKDSEKPTVKVEEFGTRVVAHNQLNNTYKFFRRFGGCADEQGNHGFNDDYIGECGNLTRADLSNQDLQNKNFQGAKLELADFGGSDLRGANFIGADLSHANLRQGAMLEGAKFSDGTILPFSADVARQEFNMVFVSFERADNKACSGFRSNDMTKIQEAFSENGALKGERCPSNLIGHAAAYMKNIDLMRFARPFGMVTKDSNVFVRKLIDDGDNESYEVFLEYLSYFEPLQLDGDLIFKARQNFRFLKALFEVGRMTAENLRGQRVCRHPMRLRPEYDKKIETIEFLIRKGISTEHLGRNCDAYELPLGYYLRGSGRNLEVAKKLLELGAKATSSSLICYLAITSQTSAHLIIDNLELIKQYGADLTGATCGDNKNLIGRIWSIDLDDYNEIEVIKYLLNEGVSPDGVTFYSSGHPHATLHTLLDVNWDETNESQFELFKLIVDKSQNLDIKSSHMYETLLHAFANRSPNSNYKRYSEQAIRYLVSKGADVNALNKYLEPPYYECRTEECRALFIELGTDFNMVVEPETGMRLIHNLAAFRIGNEKDIQTAIDNGADPLAVDNKGMTLVEYSIEQAGRISNEFLKGYFPNHPIWGVKGIECTFPMGKKIFAHMHRSSIRQSERNPENYQGANLMSSDDGGQNWLHLMNGQSYLSIRPHLSRKVSRRTHHTPSISFYYFNYSTSSEIFETFDFVDGTTYLGRGVQCKFLQENPYIELSGHMFDCEHQVHQGSNTPVSGWVRLNRIDVGSGGENSFYNKPNNGYYSNRFLSPMAFISNSFDERPVTETMYEWRARQSTSRDSHRHFFYANKEELAQLQVGDSITFHGRLDEPAQTVDDFQPDRKMSCVYRGQ